MDTPNISTMISRETEAKWLHSGSGFALSLVLLVTRVVFLAFFMTFTVAILINANASLIRHARTRYWEELTLLQFMAAPLQTLQTPLVLIAALLLSFLALVVVFSIYLAADIRMLRLAEICFMRDDRTTAELLTTPFSLYLREFKRDDEILRGGESEYIAPDPYIDSSLFLSVHSFLLLPIHRINFELRRMRLWSLEELLARSVTPNLGLVAIGRPGEKIPAVGAIKYYVSDDNWRMVVAHLVKHAKLIFLRIGVTDGLAWEINHVLCSHRDVPVVLVLIDENGHPMPSRIATTLLGDIAGESLGAELGKFLYVRTCTIMPDGTARATGYSLSQWLRGSRKFFGWQSVIDDDVRGILNALEMMPNENANSDNSTSKVPAQISRILRSWWLAMAASAPLVALYWPNLMGLSRLMIERLISMLSISAA